MMSFLLLLEPWTAKRLSAVVKGEHPFSFLFRILHSTGQQKIFALEIISTQVGSGPIP
jgi:hypothetical protein